ncbi:mitochondrial fission regulator 2 [Rhinophrynus dorsalis]
MSLLLDLLRQLFEHLGIPVEQLVPIWEHYTNRRRFVRALEAHLPSVLPPGISMQVIQVLHRKEYGWTRSIVRVIGTLLPLDPCPRPHFQHVLRPGIVEQRVNGAVCRPGIPSLADVPLLTDDEVSSYTTFRHDLPGNRAEEIKSFTRSRERNPGFLTMIAGSGATDSGCLAPSENAIQKIAALEEELNQLRAQIAAIVAMQDTKSTPSCSETLCSFGSPTNTLPSPSLTSTPLSAQLQQDSTPVPPPPPPPPPPPSAKLDSRKSAIDLIKERRASHNHSPNEKEMVLKDSTAKLPSMMDVLKGMNSIRLRAVERSPGGTPLTRKGKKRHSLNDPAAIIAQALKQKFAHKINDDSYDKGNLSHEESAFSSPETPRFGRHLLKPVGKRTQTENERKQTSLKPRAHV